MCHPRKIAMHDYQESVTTGQTDTRTDRETPDKVIPMCRYASQATQKDERIFHGVRIGKLNLREDLLDLDRASARGSTFPFLTNDLMIVNDNDFFPSFSPLLDSLMPELSKIEKVLWCSEKLLERYMHLRSPHIGA